MNEAIENYVDKMKAVHHCIESGIWRDIITEHGRKYVKVCSILSNGQKCAVQFVDPDTGNIYKAKSWKQRGRMVGNIETIFNS